MKKNSFKIMFPLLLVVFIDSMGMGLFFPVLSSLILTPASQFLSGHYTTESRQFIYGLILSIYMFSWFFGAAILGDVSDFIGRKKSLLICLAGAALGYIVAGLSVSLHSVTLMIVGRLIAGFTAGSQSIAQAAIIDISDNEHKSRHMSWMVLTSSFGFLLGPVLGGILSSSHLVDWFNFSVPLYFAALISIINMGLLLYVLQETFVPTKTFQLRWSRAVEIFVSAFKHSQVRKLSVVLSLMEIGWGAYFSFIVTFLVVLFHFDSLQSGLFLALMGLGFSLGSGFLVPLCAKLMSLKQSVIVTFLIAGSAILLMTITQSLHITLAVALIDGACIAVVYGNLLTLFSNQVTPEEQGWVMGMTGSVGAFCFGVIALLGSVVSFLGVSAPLVIGGLGLIAGGLLLYYVPVKGEASNIM